MQTVSLPKASVVQTESAVGVRRATRRKWSAKISFRHPTNPACLSSLRRHDGSPFLVDPDQCPPHQELLGVHRRCAACLSRRSGGTELPRRRDVDLSEKRANRQGEMRGAVDFDDIRRGRSDNFRHGCVASRPDSLSQRLTPF